MHEGRIDRRYYSYSDSPYTRRSLYQYHRDYYPSSRIFYWISWPDCCWPICYTSGPHYSFGAFWPYYHRRFVFVSLGGYWPDYPYRRYYWYGCHPYRWYGYYPPGYVIGGDTYNYYYYNDEPRGEALEEAHRKFEQSPPPEPADESQTDRDFEQGVKAFETGNYATAAEKFEAAQKLAPNDIVLPFARVQALFASGIYYEATQVLREALVTASPDKEGVFYPRGLYSDETVLSQQIEQLSRAVQINPADSDLRLLLGYQLLGMNRLDEAGEHLQAAGGKAENHQAATTLTSLLKRLRKPAGSQSDANEQPPSAPEPDGGSAKTQPIRDTRNVDIRALALAADGWLVTE